MAKSTQKSMQKPSKEKRSPAKPRAREPSAEAAQPIAAEVADKAPPDTYGVDQDRPVTRDAVNFASQKLGRKPELWGRYFKGPGNKHPTQYQSDKEANLFFKAGIRVLPIARQTTQVSKPDKELGRTHGLRNAAAVMASFGGRYLSRMNGVAVFLDVEPDSPLNEEYYAGWSEGLVDAGRKNMIDEDDEKITFIPCVYGHHRDNRTWRALGQAINNGATCEAAWIIYVDDPKKTRKPQFPIGPWIDSEFTSGAMPVAVRVALCQRVQNVLDTKKIKYDFNLVNPRHKDWLLDRLVLPEEVSILT